MLMSLPKLRKLVKKSIVYLTASTITDVIVRVIFRNFTKNELFIGRVAVIPFRHY